MQITFQLCRRIESEKPLSSSICLLLTSHLFDDFITSTKKGFVFTPVHLFAVRLVCRQNYRKITEQIFMKLRR